MAATDLAPITVRGTEYSDRGYCYEPFYDGPVIHTVYCVRGPEDTGISGHGCIRSDQDGAAIKAERDAKAEERRFTPPEYRTPGGKPPRRKPGPIIAAAQGQIVERVALRGPRARIRVPDRPRRGTRRRDRDRMSDHMSATPPCEGPVLP